MTIIKNDLWEGIQMLIRIYDFNNYKDYIQTLVSKQPKSGHGFYRKMALKLNVSTTLMSQVFNGDKPLSLELAMKVAEYIGLLEKESEYFITLVEYDRAGSQSLKQMFFKKIKRAQKEQSQLGKRIDHDIEINDMTKSIFYSNWLYTGLRNLIAIPEFAHLEKISERLQITPQKLKEIVGFLVQHGFCDLQNGHIKIGPQKTFISKDSPWAQQHHQNWRIKAIEKMPMNFQQNIFYTGPMSMSHDVAEQVRNDILKLIESVYEKVGPSTSETVRCFNLDWFEY